MAPRSAVAASPSICRIMPMSPMLSPIALRPSPKVDGALRFCISIASAIFWRNACGVSGLPAPAKNMLGPNKLVRSGITQPSECCPSPAARRCDGRHRSC
jgi:hypothetical protein